MYLNRQLYVHHVLAIILLMIIKSTRRLDNWSFLNHALSTPKGWSDLEDENTYFICSIILIDNFMYIMFQQLFY